jgi:hypothetical protein
MCDVDWVQQDESKAAGCRVPADKCSVPVKGERYCDTVTIRFRRTVRVSLVSP